MRRAGAYPNDYSQAILNILINARDVLLERAVCDPRILIHTFGEGDKAAVTITDNAGGIAEDFMLKIFDPYFTTRGPDKGTGIGSFMSKTIIEKTWEGS
jgi:signal transduction histidine kinase